MNLESGDLLSSFIAHRAAISDVHVLLKPDGTPIAVTLGMDGATRGGSIRVWNLLTHKPFGSRFIAHTCSQRRIDTFLLPNGRPAMMLGTNHPLFEVWGIAKRQQLVDASVWSPIDPSAVTVVRDAAGALIGVTVDDESAIDPPRLFAWDVMSGVQLADPRTPTRPATAWTALTSELGEAVVLALSDGTIAVERLATGESLSQWHHGGSAVLDIHAAALTNGRLLCASAHDDGWLHVGTLSLAEMWCSPRGCRAPSAS